LVRQKGVAKLLHQVAPQPAGLSACCDGARDSLERAGDVSFGEGFNQLDERAAVVFAAARSCQLLERGLSVPSGSATPSYSELDGFWGQTELSILVDTAQQVRELVTVQQPELEMLRPRPDRREHLLGVRRGEHEHNTAWRLFEGLQQSARRVRGELVDLVDDVDLPAAGGPEGDT
jgi:hypothetical protein